MVCSAQQAKKLPGWSEGLASAHIFCYWQTPSLYAVLLPSFSSLHLLPQVNSLQSETHQPLPLFPFSQSLSFDPGCTHVLPSFIPSPSFEHPSIPRLLSCSSCSFYTNWLSTSSTATYWLSSRSLLPLRPSFSLPPLSPTLPPNALLWSHRSPYWWQHLATVRERVSRFLSFHCTVIVAVMP